MTYTDIPTWAGILSVIAGLAITIAMGKWAGSRERRRNGIKSKISA